MWRILPFILLGLTALGIVNSCRETPGEKAVDNAEKRAEQTNQQASQQLQQAHQQIEQANQRVQEANQQVELAHQEVKHQQRLRDIDKLKCESQVAEIQTAWSFWRLWMIALAIVLVIVMVWLAREIRFRRVLAHVLFCIRRQEQEGGDA